MREKTKRLLFWAPRVLTILFILFLGLFALDVFGQGYTFWETLVALFIHLIPNMILALILILAWKWEWIGTVLFAALGIFYIGWTWGRFPILAYVVISGSLFLVAALFLVGWTLRREIRV
jgi:hypothetical protein